MDDQSEKDYNIRMEVGSWNVRMLQEDESEKLEKCKDRRLWNETQAKTHQGL